MRSTGIVRKVDELGRIVLPVELRRVMNIQIKDSLEIMTEDDKIILKKYEPCCVFCHSKEDVQEFKGHCVCQIVFGSWQKNNLFSGFSGHIWRICRCADE